MELRERLAGLLDVREWSQGKLAARTGISRSHITMFLNGQRQDTGFSKIRSIACALDVSLDWLAGLPKQNPKELEPDEAELVKLYRSLPDYEKPAILGSVRLHARITRREE